MLQIITLILRESYDNLSVKNLGFSAKLSGIEDKSVSFDEKNIQILQILSTLGHPTVESQKFNILHTTKLIMPSLNVFCW